ncbi:MAG: tetratricopeptide repeat protein, partial [Syntrophobacteraceae bacterium]
RYRAELENKKKPQKPAAKITWEGSQLVGHSLAFVNRELCLRLIDSGHEVSIVPFEKNDAEIAADPRFKKIVERTRKPLSGKADVHVRHQWPPNFNPPPEGHWVIIQPWEFGSLPKAWVHPMSTLVDEIWVPSAFVRESFIGSGIPADRVFVIPNGVDTRIFNPAAPPIRLNTKKRFKFLFVGGTIARKGIDILLDVYTGTFSDKDDVCLVIKDMGAKTFYRDRTAQDLIRERQSLPGAPEIEYIDHMLSDKDMAGLYTACDCLVHPYKGEGFGLPIAESMACERPVIITGYGAALDFCSEESAYLLSSRIVLFPEKRLDNFETVSFPWLAEPNREHLRKIMKHICEHPSELKLKGKAGCNRISRDFTWERAAEMVEDRIQALAAKPILRFHASARAEHEAYPPVLPAVRATSPGTELPGLILPENTGSPEQAAQSRSKDAPRNPGIAGQEDTAGILTAQGELQFERGRPDRARTCFEMALDENPAHAAALSNLGVICLREGKVTEALEFLRKALDSDSESPDILLNSARALQAAGELDSAAELLKIYLQKYPDDEDVWEEHVEVIRQSARPVWTQEGLPGQVADLYVESGKLLAFAGDILGAAASFQKAMKLDPERPEPYFLLGQLHLEIGQKEEAAEYFHAGISVAPPGNGTVPMPGGILVSRDRREEAEALYDSLLSAHSG